MVDLYREKAAEVFDIPTEQVTEEQRQFVKIFMHAAQYGVQSTLAKTLANTVQTHRIASGSLISGQGIPEHRPDDLTR